MFHQIDQKLIKQSSSVTSAVARSMFSTAKMNKVSSMCSNILRRQFTCRAEEIPLDFIKYSKDMDIIGLLKERGLISATTANLGKHFGTNVNLSIESLTRAIEDSTNGKSMDTTDNIAAGDVEVIDTGRTVYAGFDPTADSLHLGNLLVIMALVHFHRAGHKAVALVGGATGLVGDPSGRSSERVLLTNEEVQKNVDGIKGCLQHFLQPNRDVAFSNTKESPQFVDNNDWYSKMSVVDYLRDIGKYFRVNQMLAKDSVKRRMENSEDGGLSFTEFSYQTLQGFDFHYLQKHYGCSVQIGGSDQWGNITAGIDYIHKVSEDSSVGNGAHGLTLPLLTTSNGQKFGKSAGNAIWLSAAKTSPYAMYQYLLSVADADVCKLLKAFTLLTTECVNSIVHLHIETPELRVAQEILANQLVSLIHGRVGLVQARVATKVLFGKDASQQNTELSMDEFIQALQGVPIVKLPAMEVHDIPTLCVKAGMCKSKAEAKRLIQQNGLSVNGVKPKEEEFKQADAWYERVVLLRSGQKKHFLVVFDEAPAM